MNNLDQLLKNLPPVIHKTSMWLVHKDQKKMATINVGFDWSFSPLVDPEKQNLEDEKLFTEWLTETKIKYQASQRASDTLHLSKDATILEKNHELELDESVEAHTFRGTMYGFGQECSLAFAQAAQKEPMFPSDLVIHAPMVPELANKDWYPYIEYLVRRGHELEDAMTAKNWAEICRRDIPEIAIEFETNRMKDDIPFREALQKFYK